MTRPKKRMGKEDAPSREAFLNAAERLLHREGYASVIARKVAQEAGLKKQLLYYYFNSMDDLICEVHDRSMQSFNIELHRAVESEEPLRAIWRLLSGFDGKLLNELMAMAGHSEALRERIAKNSASHYKLMANSLEEVINKAARYNAATPSPAVSAFLLLSVARNYLLERDLGFLESRDELEAWLEWCFQRFERPEHKSKSSKLRSAV